MVCIYEEKKIKRVDGNIRGLTDCFLFFLRCSVCQFEICNFIKKYSPSRPLFHCAVDKGSR